jgi:pyrroloquinoline quinone (PQQ) biosynthesis protein C
MNSLYTSGVRQTNSLQVDMERLRNGDNSPALLGAYIQPQIYFQTQWLTDQAYFVFRTNICISFCDAADNR